MGRGWKIEGSSYRSSRKDTKLLKPAPILHTQMLNQLIQVAAACS